MATATLKAKLTLNDNAYQAGLRKAVTLAKSAGAKIKGALSVGLKLGAGAGALGAAVGGAALAKGIKGAYDMGGALSDLMSRTGATGESLLVLSQALADSGVDASQTGTIINKMQRAMSDAAGGSKKMSATFADLGINVGHLMRMAPDRQMQVIGRAINAIPDPARKAAAAMELFGRSGGELLTLFADDGAIDGARGTLGSMAEILARNAATFDIISDRLSHVGKKFEGFMVGVASTFAPSMLAVTAAIERADFAAQGERFGAAMQKAAEVMTAIWHDPESLFQPMSDFLSAMWKKAANWMVAAFKQGFSKVGGYMLEAVNKFRAAHIAVFEEIMSKIPGSGYDKNKTIEQRMRDSERSGSGSTLRNAAAKLIGAKLDVKDLFGASASARSGIAGLRRLQGAGKAIQERSAPREMIGPQYIFGPHRPSGPEMIGPQLPGGWRRNPFANFKTMGFGAGGLGSTGGLGGQGGLGSAYNKIRQGDAARRRAEANKVKDPVEKSNELLHSILKVTETAWT